MKYEDIRHEIKTFDVLAWDESGPWTSIRQIQLNLIKMFTMSEYNHVGLAFVTGGRVFVVESVVPDIRIYPLSKELPCYLIKTKFKFTKEHEEYMLSKVGLKYSKWEALKAFFTSDTNNPNKWQCAKFVNDVLAQVTPAIVDIKDTPHDTVKYLTEDCDGSITMIE